MSGFKISNFQTNSWKALLHIFPNVPTYALSIWMSAAVPPQTPTASLEFPSSVSLPDLILSGYPCFALSWCHLLLLLTSCRPVCRLLPAILLCFFHSWRSQRLGWGSRKQKANKQANIKAALSSLRPPPISPFHLLTMNGVSSKESKGFWTLPPIGWVAALSEPLFCLPSFPLKEYWRNRKAEIFCWKSRAKARTHLGRAIKNHGTQNCFSDANCVNAPKYSLMKGDCPAGQ